MKKLTTKKGWLLGLLVGLVMVIGASPALAYTFAASFDCNGISGNYSLGAGDDLFLDGNPIDFWDKYEYNSKVTPPAWEWTNGGAGLSVATSGDQFGTSWTATTTDLPQYVLFKGGSIKCDGTGGYIYLYKLYNV